MVALLIDLPKERPTVLAQSTSSHAQSELFRAADERGPRPLDVVARQFHIGKRLHQYGERSSRLEAR